MKNPIDHKDESGPADSFDLDRLRLSQDFASAIGVKKALLTVPVRKPDRQWFVRVHADEAYRLQVAVIELRDEREIYLVDPVLCPELPAEVVPKVLFTAINRQNIVFLWPVRLPREDGRLDEWNRSALDAAELAMHGWLRVVANMSLGAYEVFQATAALAEPEWPEHDLGSLLRIAFRDRLIQTLEHPVIQRLRGAR